MLKVIDFDEARGLLGSERIPLYALTVIEGAARGDVVTCGECELRPGCPMRSGDGAGFCWQGRRRDG